MTDVTKNRSDEQAGAPEAAQAATPQTDGAESGSLPEHSGVVERVGAILQSAEAAATAIRAEAVAKAEEITRAAAEEGQSHVSQAKQEATRIRSSAEEAAKEARSAAESYGAKQRREAEQRVEQLLAEGEAQARATRQAAEEMARQIEQAAREREERLKAQMRPLETSLRRALEGFRGITAQLEELLGTETPQEGETLVEALNEPVRRAGDWVETPAPSPPAKPERTNAQSS